MMKNFPAIRNVLGSIFSVEVGLSEDEEKMMLARVLNSDDYRNRLREELKMVLSDSKVSYIELLENDRYEVYCADSEEDAKRYLIDIFRDNLFPGEGQPEA